MKHGFIKVAAAVPTVSVGDCQYNLMQIENLIAQAEGKGVEIIVFPELSLTGYTCQDLFRQNLLIDAAEQSVMMLLDFTRQLDIIAIVGLPIAVGDLLLNCAAHLRQLIHVRAVDHCRGKRAALPRLGVIIIIGGAASLLELRLFLS